MLHRNVAWELTDEPYGWTDMHTVAWDAALLDAVEAPPIPYAWVDQGRPLERSEGRGGAP